MLGFERDARIHAQPVDQHIKMTSQLLYIVHAAEDRKLAIFLKSQCEDCVPGLRAFVASKAGRIPTGTDWLTEIHHNLQGGTAFLLLLTPRSIKKFWVWYEAGAAWKSGQARFPVAAAGLDRNEIPLPLGASQTLVLDNADDAAQLFIDLGGDWRRQTSSAAWSGRWPYQRQAPNQTKRPS
jgi:hypothetical protein